MAKGAKISVANPSLIHVNCKDNQYEKNKVYERKILLYYPWWAPRVSYDEDNPSAW